MYEIVPRRVVEESGEPCEALCCMDVCIVNWVDPGVDEVVESGECVLIRRSGKAAEGV